MPSWPHKRIHGRDAMHNTALVHFAPATSIPRCHIDAALGPYRLGKCLFDPCTSGRFASKECAASKVSSGPLTLAARQASSISKRVTSGAKFRAPFERFACRKCKAVLSPDTFARAAQHSVHGATKPTGHSANPMAFLKTTPRARAVLTSRVFRD